MDDVILGCVAQIGEQGANVARLAVLEAGFPVEVPAVSLDRMCSSGQQAVHFAAQAIGSGQADVVIAGGVESMSRIPMGADYPATWSPKLMERPDLEISANQGISADLIAERWGLTREELDQYAFESHLKAGEASESAASPSKIVPVEVPTEPATCGRSARTRGSGSRPRWSGWPGCSRPLAKRYGHGRQRQPDSDGAAALLLTSRQKAADFACVPAPVCAPPRSSARTRC